MHVRIVPGKPHYGRHTIERSALRIASAKGTTANLPPESAHKANGAIVFMSEFETLLFNIENNLAQGRTTRW